MNVEAQDAYERALELGLKRSEIDHTRKQRAHALFRQRRYPEAVEAFAALRQRGDVPIWRARSMARAGDVPEAIEAFEQLGRDRRSSQSVRARFLAALLLDGRGYDERAIEHFRAVARSNSGAGMGDAAAWRLGWVAYRRGRYEEAIAYFDRLIRHKQGDAIGQLRPRYWRARALEQRGDPWAVREFTAIAREFPLTYYGWRARERAHDDGRRIATPKIPLGKNRLSPTQMERPRILLEAGYDAPARDEVRRLGRSARGLDERLELARLATDAGDYNRAQRLVVDPYTEVLARGPIPRYEELWWYAWPSAYQQLVDAATAGPESVGSELVYSIMREESGYRPEVVSPVGARGLLQIMTPTGERLARDTGLPTFEADDLFVPRTNIGLGSFYLTELTNRFRGRLAPSIASYNAGPEAVSEWALPAIEDDDEWVESIPYDQTRSYVRRVLRSLHAYRLLY
jgi:soluble lytic murein transglycosylase